MSTQKPLLTTADVAERLQVTENYVRELLRTGAIESIKIGGSADAKSERRKYRVSEEALALYLFDRKITTKGVKSENVKEWRRRSARNLL